MEARFDRVRSARVMEARAVRAADQRGILSAVVHEQRLKRDEPDFRVVAAPDPAVGLVAQRGIVRRSSGPGYDDVAVFSRDEQYRYRLDRRIDDGPVITWVGLNPGTGDRDGTGRPTLRHIVTISRALGYGTIVIVNLFAYRAARPAALGGTVDPVGPDNDAVLAVTSAMAEQTVVCWGNHGRRLGRADGVCRDLLTGPLSCLGTTTRGEPFHPLWAPRPHALRAYRR